ncbi:MAG: hypothetical protein IRY98_01810, partial [Alicyclobacillaceae bacterium]|nr:hypothetical protein [Alicyclobacillaceae bacterium]
VTVPEDVIEERHLPQDCLDGLERLGQTHSGDFAERRSGDLADVMSPTFLSPGERGRVREKNAFVEMERELILRALSRYGSARKAGRALGVSHTTIIKKMKKYGIERRKVGSG